MDIQLEKHSSTEASIKISLKESDYQSKLKEKLKSYSKQAQIKGFRPGKVPVGLIEKMYGKAIKVEQINDILIESLKDYIKQNDIKIIGDPLPNNDKAKEIDWDNQKDFDFEYSVGLIDEFSYDLNIKIKKYLIKVDEQSVRDAVTGLQKRYGKMANPDTSMEGDSLFGTLQQESSQFEKDCLIELEKVSESLREKFVGISKEGAVEFDIQSLFIDKIDLEIATGLEGQEMAALSGMFIYKLKNINRTEPAEMTKEFFDRIFGEGKVNTEEEFIAEYSKIFADNYEKESDYLLSHQLQEELLKNTQISIPESFYKRWILATSESMSAEELEKDFEHYIRDLKWTLIKNRIFEDNELKVEYDELIQYTIRMFTSQFGISEPTEEMLANLQAMASNYLQQKDGQNYMNVLNQLRTEKIMEAIKQKAEISVVEVTREEFNKLVES